MPASCEKRTRWPDRIERMRPVPNHVGGQGDGTSRTRIRRKRRKKSRSGGVRDDRPTFAISYRRGAGLRHCLPGGAAEEPGSGDGSPTTAADLSHAPGRDSDRGEPSCEAMVALPGRAG